MVEIHSWMETFLEKVRDAFGGRVWFVGLQGSYSRGEATEESDIDVVVILDKISMQDVRTYREMLDRLPQREQICGFFSGKEELLKWEPSELFQFTHDTTPYIGSLEEVLSFVDAAAVERAIKIGTGGVFHGCMHNLLHERREDRLKGLYKAASVTVQAIVFRQTGSYVRYQEELLSVANPEERRIVETFLSLKKGGAVELEKMSEVLLDWAGNWIRETK